MANKKVFENGYEPKVTSKPIMLHVGFGNMIMTDQIVAILDYNSAPILELVRSAKEERPRSVIKTTRNRKAVSLIVMTGDRYVLSAIPRIRLCKRMGLNNEVRVEESNIARSQTKGKKKVSDSGDNGNSELREDSDSYDAGEENFGPWSDSS